MYAARDGRAYGGMVDRVVGGRPVRANACQAMQGAGRQHREANRYNWFNSFVGSFGIDD